MSDDVREGDRAGGGGSVRATGRPPPPPPPPARPTLATIPSESVDKTPAPPRMEIVAAADSDERGLSLLKVVNVLQRVVVFVHSLTVDKFRGKLRKATTSEEMPDMSEEHVTAKVGTRRPGPVLLSHRCALLATVYCSALSIRSVVIRRRAVIDRVTAYYYIEKYIFFFSNSH